MITGTPLDNLRWSDGRESVGLPAGSLIVLAGEPDSDACLDLAARAVRNSGASAVLIDATATNANFTEFRAVFCLQWFTSVPSLVKVIGPTLDIELWVIHSWDAWVDWKDWSALAEMANIAAEHETTILLHTKMLTDTLYFGDHIARPWASAALKVEGDEVSWLSGEMTMR